MCLSIAIKRPEDVLARGEHLGFEWMVIHNGRGYRCGYVKVPPGHPWHGGGESDALEVHGGITFGEHDKPCDKGGPDSGYWLGFDCAHAGDAPDPELPVKPERRSPYEPWPDDRVRSQAYVELECRKLCEQAKEAAAP